MYSLGQRWPGVDLWTFWLSQVEEEVEDKLGKQLFTKDHQRPFLTNWWALVAVTSYLLHAKGAWHAKYSLISQHQTTLSFESSYPCLDNELVYFPFLGRFMYLIRNAHLSHAS